MELSTSVYQTLLHLFLNQPSFYHADVNGFFFHSVSELIVHFIWNISVD